MDFFMTALTAASVVAAFLAAFFGWKAVVAAQQTIELQKDERMRSQTERRLRLLQELEHAAFRWGEKASQLATHYHSEGGPEARAAYQVAYRTAAIEFDLPVCEKLAHQADVAVVCVLHQEALMEIGRKRAAVVPTGQRKL